MTQPMRTDEFNNGQGKPTMYHASMDSINGETLHAFGSTKEEANKALAKGFDNHARQWGHQGTAGWKRTTGNGDPMEHFGASPAHPVTAGNAYTGHGTQVVRPPKGA